MIPKRRQILLILSLLLSIFAIAKVYRILTELSPQCSNGFSSNVLDNNDDYPLMDKDGMTATLLEENDIPVFRAQNISCLALFKGDEYELSVATYIHATHRYRNRTDADIIQDTRDCQHFIQQRRYAQGATSIEELEFTIAYSIMIYKDVDQFERLLRAIYRPHNLYCLHVDAKSPAEVHRAVSSISRCLSDSVFLTPYSIDVQWGRFSVLEPELICMRELWKRRRERKWKYFINLTGQEFPLKTHEEVVRILKAFNGTNNMEGTVLRIPAEFKRELENAPCGITVTKGSVHIIASYKFVNFALHSPTAKSFLHWVSNIQAFPDEIFFSSLNHSPRLKVPGAYTGIPETDSTHYRFMPRYKNWGEPPFNYPCPGGRWLRQICVLSVGDLPALAYRPELFANKFMAGFHPLALDCMEELYYNRTRLDIRERKKRETKQIQLLSGQAHGQQQQNEKLQLGQTEKLDLQQNRRQQELQQQIEQQSNDLQLQNMQQNLQQLNQSHQLQQVNQNQLQVMQLDHQLQLNQRQQKKKLSQQQQQPLEEERLSVSQSDLERRWKRLLGSLQRDRADKEAKKLLERRLDINFYRNLDFVKNHV